MSTSFAKRYASHERGTFSECIETRMGGMREEIIARIPQKDAGDHPGGGARPLRYERSLRRAASFGVGQGPGLVPAKDPASGGAGGPCPATLPGSGAAPPDSRRRDSARREGHPVSGSRRRFAGFETPGDVRQVPAFAFIHTDSGSCDEIVVLQEVQAERQGLRGLPYHGLVGQERRQAATEETPQMTSAPLRPPTTVTALPAA